MKAQNAAKTDGPASTAKTNGAKPAAKDTDNRSRDFGKTLQQDPVFKNAGLPVKFEKGGGVTWEPELRDDVAEQLGTRAEPKKLELKGFKALVDSRELQYNDMPYSANITRPPSYFPDIEECRKTCTIGATWGRFDEKRPLFLWCLNQEHFEEKLAEGHEKIASKARGAVQEIDEADTQIFGWLQQAWDEESPDLLRLIAATLGTASRLTAFTPAGVDYRYRDDFAVYTENDKRIAALAGLKLEVQESRLDPAGLLAAEPETVQEILLRLVLNARGDKRLLPFVNLLEPHKTAGPDVVVGEEESRSKASPRAGRAKAKAGAS